MEAEFWKFARGSHPALIDGATGAEITFDGLHHEVELASNRFEHWRKGQLHFILTRNRLSHAIAIISAFSQSVPIALIDPDADQTVLHDLIERYRPVSLIGTFSDLEKCTTEEYRNCDPNAEITQVVRLDDRCDKTDIHPDLACLLSTSGSTGTPKFVRISARNLISNAHDIGTVLALGMGRRTFAHLKLHYSFGLSVLTSNMLAGGTCIVSDASIVEAPFFKQMRDYEANILPGVPFHCEYLASLSLKRVKLSALDTIIQAGGSCRRDVLRLLHRDLEQRGGGVYIMYGQTEASPRITTLDRTLFNDHIDSVGKAMPSGTISILDQTGRRCAPGDIGEVVYTGPNVAMGYASSRLDLSVNDEFCGTLKTGDLGCLAENGILTLKGRIARFAKVQGVRVSLDDVESIVSRVIGEPCFATSADDKVDVFLEGVFNEEQLRSFRVYLKDVILNLRLPIGSIILKIVDNLPRRANGKPDYAKLASIDCVR